LIDSLVELAERAGDAIMAVRSGGQWTVQSKGDDSPLTQADLAANAVLMNGIAKLSPDPIVSEESAIPIFEGGRFWLIDPLDGTRDFVAGQDTFVVCIALIENEKPILAVVHSPVTRETFWAVRGKGAFKRIADLTAPIRHPKTNRGLQAAGSRSMPSDRMKFLYEIFGIESVTRFGSALKFCRVAEGVFDVYPRFGTTSEWDTAAGQLICEESGCTVISLKTGKPLLYRKPSYLNEGFIAIRDDADVAKLLSKLKENGLFPASTR
jgi:3'(2'), 5'-bisphosphate nucleotidase